MGKGWFGERKKEPIGFSERGYRDFYYGEGDDGLTQYGSYGHLSHEYVYDANPICLRKGCTKKTGGAKFCSLECYGIYKLEATKEVLKKLATGNKDKKETEK